MPKTPSQPPDNAKNSTSVPRGTMAERRRKALVDFLDQHDLTAAGLARRAGLSTANTLYNFLNGQSASLAQSTMEKIAAAFPDGSADMLIIRLLHPAVPAPQTHQAPPGILVVAVIAETKLGVRQPMKAFLHTDHVKISVPAALLLKSSSLFGVRVGRPGAEGLYPAGSVLICEAATTLHPSLKDGCRVVVTVTHDGGIEVTVRRVQVHEARFWLWPDTTDPRQQRPLLAPRPTDIAENGDITILGKVIATLQPKLLLND